MGRGVGVAVGSGAVVGAVVAVGTGVAAAVSVGEETGEGVASNVDVGAGSAVATVSTGVVERASISPSISVQAARASRNTTPATNAMTDLKGRGINQVCHRVNLLASVTASFHYWLKCWSKLQVYSRGRMCLDFSGAIAPAIVRTNDRSPLEDAMNVHVYTQPG